MQAIIVINEANNYKDTIDQSDGSKTITKFTCSTNVSIEVMELPQINHFCHVYQNIGQNAYIKIHVIMYVKIQDLNIMSTRCFKSQ